MLLFSTFNLPSNSFVIISSKMSKRSRAHISSTIGCLHCVTIDHSHVPKHDPSRGFFLALNDEAAYQNKFCIQIRISKGRSHIFQQSLIMLLLTILKRKLFGSVLMKHQRINLFLQKLVAMSTILTAVNEYVKFSGMCMQITVEYHRTFLHESSNQSFHVKNWRKCFLDY